jgi:hypothetical protein
MNRINLLRRHHEEYLELFDIPEQLKRKETPKVAIKAPSYNIDQRLRDLKSNYNVLLQETISSALKSKKKASEAKRRLVVIEKPPK